MPLTINHSPFAICHSPFAIHNEQLTISRFLSHPAASGPVGQSGTRIGVPAACSYNFCHFRQRSWCKTHVYTLSTSISWVSSGISILLRLCPGLVSPYAILSVPFRDKSSAETWFSIFHSQFSISPQQALPVYVRKTYGFPSARSYIAPEAALAADRTCGRVFHAPRGDRQR